MTTTYVVKSWPQFFNEIWRGDRHHELRRDDRGGYKIGDILWLHEWDPEAKDYTGRDLKMEITSVTSSEHPCAVSENGLNEGYIILSIQPVKPKASCR